MWTAARVGGYCLNQINRQKIAGQSDPKAVRSSDL